MKGYGVWLLAVERSCLNAGVALFRDGQLVDSRCDAGEPSRAPNWMAAVHAILQEHEVRPAQISALCAGLGPGSFSGIRSSLAALQGLALPHGLPIFGVSSAAALALRLLSATDAPETISIVGDARRQRVWLTTLRLADDGDVAVIRQDGTVAAAQHTAADFLLLSPDACAAAIPEKTHVASSDLARIGTQLTQEFGTDRVLSEAVFSDAASVGRLFLAAPALARRNPLPIYLYPAVAERPA